MVNYELKPTTDNIKLTLLNNSVGRNEGIAHFIELLNGIEGNSVIALDDKWGNGKTFLSNSYNSYSKTGICQQMRLLR